MYKCQTVEDNHGSQNRNIKSRQRQLTRIPLTKSMISGNALHYCNCHGSGCNKDWSTAEGGDNQPTSKPDGPTVKYKQVFDDFDVCDDNSAN